MTIYVLVEGPSELAFLNKWMPRLSLSHNFSVFPHQGKGSIPKQISAPPEPHKRGLLDQLPAKLRAFSSTLNPHTDGIAILVDADSDNVKTLTSAITTTVAGCCPNLKVSVCVAVEEMEAFYLSDLGALQTAYPDYDAAKARTYVPDSVCGTWELFGEVIGDDGGNKVAWGAKMGQYVTTTPAKSRSPSFKKALAAVKALDALPTTQPVVKKKFRHAAKPTK